MVSFPDGKFTPGAVRKSRDNEQLSDDPVTQLSLGEQDILDRLGGRESQKVFGTFTRQLGSVIVADEIGVDASVVHPERARLQRFFKRLTAEGDKAFDADRDAFADSITAGKEAFWSAITDVEVTRVGEPFFTTGEGFAVFDKKIKDPTLYPPKAQVLIKEQVATLLDHGVVVTMNDSHDLSDEDTMKLKETTNGLYAQVFFGLLYSPYLESDGYDRAQDRFVASVLAFQYVDDVLDAGGDALEGSANLLNAVAEDMGESTSLRHALNAQAQLDVSDVSRERIVSYCKSVQDAAPRSYEKILSRQRELLEIASLPSEIFQQLTLPDGEQK